MDGLYRRLVAGLSSRLCFAAIWLVAVLQASWVAIVSRYPMAFDEAYHYNLVRLHAQQWSPLFLHQPAGSAPYGALVRDPSYLHHYLLSFPYRIMEALGASLFTKVVVLRLSNVLLFAVGLWLFRRLLLQTKASRAAVHAVLLFFILIPTVPLLAGQINYDNLQFPLVAAALLLALRAARGLQKRRPNALHLVQALAIALLGTLNKFTFLPILTAIVLYLGFVAVRSYPRPNKLAAALSKSWRSSLGWQKRFWLATLGVVASLFVWFYGVNLVMYHNPVVQCHQVISPSRCVGFEPWLRNYTLAQESIKANPNPVLFSVNWVGGMFYRTFFTINGATGPHRYDNDVAPVMAGTAILLAVAVFVLALRYSRRILQRDQPFQLLLFVSAIYLVSLWGRNYNDFLHLGQMVAINGRYLQPVLLPVLLLAVASYQWAFRLMPAVKLGIFVGACLLFLSGGGITGFIHYSNADWYWQGEPVCYSTQSDSSAHYFAIVPRLTLRDFISKALVGAHSSLSEEHKSWEVYFESFHLGANFWRRFHLQRI